MNTRDLLNWHRDQAKFHTDAVALLEPLVLKLTIDVRVDTIPIAQAAEAVAVRDLEKTVRDLEKTATSANLALNDLEGRN